MAAPAEANHGQKVIMKTKFAILGLAASHILAPDCAPAATFTVVNTADSGAGSLRQAMLDANAASGDDVIVFALTGTITLASALPALTDNSAITGPGTNLLTISGNNAVRVFSANAGTTNTISGLTIANGLATGYANGAGIANAGKLTILNCALLNNTNLGGWGGAVFNSGNLAILNSTFSGNQVTGENGLGGAYFAAPGAGGGAAGLGGGLCSLTGTLLINGCTFISNSATGGNGGAETGGAGRGGGITGGQGGGGFNDTPGNPGGFACGGGGGGDGARHAGQGGFGGGGGGGDGAAGYGGGNGGSYLAQGRFGQGGGGGGGAGMGGGIFVSSGTVTILNCSFFGNCAMGGSGGTGSLFNGNHAGGGGNGSGVGPDFFNNAATILPILTTTTLGGGSATATPSSPPYLDNSTATVTAIPAAGWNFLHWLGDASGTNPVIQVSVTQNKYVQAVFGTHLTNSVFMFLHPQADLYPYGTPIKLTALPPSGTYFSAWSGDASGTNNPLSIAVTNPNQSFSCQLGTLSAGQFALTVIENGRGHIGLNPLANYYISGQTVALTATPDAGQDFVGWSGDVTGSQNPLLVAMTQSKVITANFTKRPSLRVGTPLEGLIEGGFRLTLLGEFGTAYQILGSTNLAVWSEAGIVTNTYGTVQLTDSAATNLSYRFYRAATN
jgi:hypothetical protein